MELPRRIRDVLAAPAAPVLSALSVAAAGSSPIRPGIRLGRNQALD